MLLLVKHYNNTNTRGIDNMRNNNTKRIVDIRARRGGLVKDDKQQSSDSIEAGLAAVVTLLLTTVNSYSYTLRTLSILLLLQ